VAAALGRLPVASVDAVNGDLLRLSRVLIPLAYTSGDRFAHDLALPIAPLAGLQRCRELPGLDPESDAFKFARVGLVRERNRVVHALDTAVSIADALMQTEPPRRSDTTEPPPSLSGHPRPTGTQRSDERS
jgi:hypothetical protein